MYTRVLSIIAVFVTLNASAQDTNNSNSNAIQRAQRALEKNPSNPELVRRVVELSHDSGGLPQLIGAYDKRTKTSPTDSTSWLVLGQLQKYGGDCLQAVKSFEHVARVSPKNGHAHLGLGLCHISNSAFPAAVKSLELAATTINGRDNKKTALKGLIRAAIKTKQLELVRNAFVRLTNTDPGNLFLRVDHARALVAAGLIDEAILNWREIQKRATNDPKLKVQAINALGQLLNQKGRSREAIALFKNTLKKLPEEHWAQLELQEGLIAIYRKQGRISAYIAELERGRRTYPVLLTLAQLYEETGADKKALSAYRLAVSQRPANSEARTALLRIVKRIGTRKQLVAEYERLIKRVPGEPQYPLELAGLYLSGGAKKKAFALLDRISRNYSDDPGVHESIVDLFLQHNAGRARIEREFNSLIRLEPHQEQHIVQLGEYYFSENARSKAVTTWRRLLKSIKNKAQGHLALARVFAEHDMQSEAQNHFREATKRAPKNLRIFKAYAKYLEKVDNYTDAASVWQKIGAMLAPTDWHQRREARQQLVKIYKKAGTLNIRIQEHKRQFDASPPALSSGLFLAEAYLQRKSFDDAAITLEKIAKERPRDLEAMLYLEEVYQKLNRLPDAIRMLQLIADLNPRLARSKIRQMAKLSMDLNRAKDALKYAKLVVSLNPSDATATTNLGDLYVQLRQFQKALPLYQRSLQLMPSSIPVRFKMARLLRRLNLTEQYNELLAEIVTQSHDPSDVLRAGRRILASPNTESITRFEQQLWNLVYQRAQKPVYRKLLIELYSTLVRRIEANPNTPNTVTKLRSIGDRGLKPIMDSLATGDLSVRTRVLRILIATRPQQSVLPVIRLLEEHDLVLRFQAIAALAHLGVPSAVNAISPLATDPNSKISTGAVWALGAFVNQKAGAVLSTLAAQVHRQTSIPTLVALALGVRGKTDGYKAALKLFADGHKFVRPFAAWALGAIGDKRGLEPLIRRLPLETPEMKHKIIWALGAIGSQKALGPILKELWGPHGSLHAVARWAVSQIMNPQPLNKDKIRDTFLALHDFDNATIRFTDALNSLISLEGQPPDIQRLLNVHGPLARKTLMHQLENANSSDSLLRSLTAGKTGVGLGALSLNHPMPTRWLPDVIKHATQLVSHPQVEVRKTAARLLGRSGDRSVISVLARTLDDASPGVRKSAAMALADTARADALTVLLKKWSTTELKDNWSGRIAFCHSAKSLIELDRQQAAPVARIMMSLLSDRFPSVRLAALQGLMSLGESARIALKPTLARLNDGDVGVAVAATQLLVKIGDKTAIQPLRKLANSSDYERREAANRALTTFEKNK